MEVGPVNHIRTGDDTILQLIRQRRVQLVLNTITGSAGAAREGGELLDGFQIRRAAVETGIPCLTSLDTARAVLETVGENGSGGYSVLPIGEYRQA